MLDRPPTDRLKLTLESNRTAVSRIKDEKIKIDQSQILKGSISGDPPPPHTGGAPTPGGIFSLSPSDTEARTIETNRGVPEIWTLISQAVTAEEIGLPLAAQSA